MKPQKNIISKSTRVLVLGTDINVGKKYTAIKFTEALNKWGFDASFKGTRTLELLELGKGLNAGAVPSNYLTMFVENLFDNNDPTHIDVIEGQGSLLHPIYCPTTLGLIAGTKPDFIIVCHDYNRQYMVETEIELNLSKEIKSVLYMANIFNRSTELLAVSTIHKPDFPSSRYTHFVPDGFWNEVPSWLTPLIDKVRL